MKIKDAKESKNVDDIRKQKPKVRTGNLMFQDPFIKNQKNKNNTITNKSTISKKKSAPMPEMTQGLAEMGVKAGRLSMDKAANESMAKNPTAPKWSMQPMKITGPVFPEEIKNKPFDK